MALLTFAALAPLGCGGQSQSGANLPAGQGAPKVIQPRVTIELGETPEPSNLVLSADGKLLIGGATGEKKNVQFWDLDKRQLLRATDEQSGTHVPVALSPDGKIVAYGTMKQQIPLLDADSGKELRRLQKKEGALGFYIAGVHFSRSGDLVAAASGRDIVGWDPRSGEQRFVWHDGAEIHSLSEFFDGDKKIATGGANDTVKVWDVTTGKPVWSAPGKKDHDVTSLTASDDGSVLVSSASVGPLKVWNAATGAALREIDVSLSLFQTVLFLPKSKSVAYTATDFKIYVVDVNTGTKTHRLEGHKEQAQGLAASADGTVVVSSARDGTIRVWDLK